MCGIAGIVGWNAAVPPVLMERMDAALAHRGPDGRGFLACERDGRFTRVVSPDDLPAAPVLLGHRRLAILDISAQAAQPMSTADGRYHIVFNGEIYDYIEHRNRLEALGETFVTESDTEVLLRLLAREGVAALAEVTGMYAFALLDAREGTLLIARDPFGIKPLYCCFEDDRLYFASEIKAILAVREAAPKAHPVAVQDYLVFGRTDHDTFTMFDGVRHLAPGHWVQVDLNSKTVQGPERFYLPPDIREGSSGAESFGEEFFRSVELHMRSDVPFGAALSGGLDSSGVAAAMRRALPQGELRAVSYVPADKSIDESAYAVAVAQSLGMDRLTASPHATDWERLLRLVRTQDEPFAGTSILAQDAVYSRAAEAGIKVMLDGQGADELLAGYPACLGAAAVSMLSHSRVGAAWRTARSMDGALPAALGFLTPAVVRDVLMNRFGAGFSAPWLAQTWFRGHGCRPRALHPSFGLDPLRPYLDRLLFSAGLPHLLRYQDRNSMYRGIEARVPFLTPRLYAVCRGLDSKWLVAGDGTSKVVLRHVLRGMVPESVLLRRDKIGFFTPERDMLASVATDALNVLDSWAGRPCPVNVLAARPRIIAAFGGQICWKPWMWRVINLLVWADVFGVSFE